MVIQLGCTFANQHWGPHAARGPQFGYACSVTSYESSNSSFIFVFPNQRNDTLSNKFDLQTFFPLNKSKL